MNNQKPEEDGCSSTAALSLVNQTTPGVGMHGLVLSLNILTEWKLMIRYMTTGVCR
jgi:hypothetical protein